MRAREESRAGVIGQEIIETIRERTSIEELIGESVKLEQRGRSAVGLCPFHQEKTPSFHVSDERGRYHCFGCGASGDVFRFVQETEGLSFIEAVKQLGQRAGVVVEDDLSDAERKQQTAARRREDQLFSVNRAAASYFEKMLIEHPERKAALDELQGRGLGPESGAEETLSAFRIGYAPSGWDGLTNHLRASGLDLAAAESAGLIAARKQSSGYYDRFRHRLMFAVIDLQGRVVAFSGRALPGVTTEGDPPAKYINSPESPIYKKRQTVFGLYQARATLRNGTAALLVEGNFDVMSLHAKGLTQAVAPLGTAFTPEQGRSIRRFCAEVVVCFDGDRAGREATQKARQPIKEAGLTARVARLPEGADPDDFVRTKGPEALSRVIASSQGMLDYLISELLDERFSADDAAARGQKIKQILELLSSEDDPTVRALAEQYADTLASRLGVADARTFRALRASVQKSLSKPGPRQGDAASGSAQGSSGNSSRNKGELEMMTSIIGALLDFPELLDSEELLLYADRMEGELAAVVACFHRVRRSSGAHGAELSARDLHEALAKMPENVRPFVQARLAAPLHSVVKTARAELSGNLKKLMHIEHARISTSTLSELEKARRAGDFDQELDLLRKQQLRARRRRGME